MRWQVRPLAAGTEGQVEVHKRKLIEVALPLEAINRESAREKEPFTRRHPRSIHIWWARRPLTAARAVLFAQLVDDPSARPDEFPTEELQRVERERLHTLIERLCIWENSWDLDLLNEAREEILKSCDGVIPVIHDPFAGGGTIPLEAQRLGLESIATDLNPVAVLINRALIEIPVQFRGKAPVFPGLAGSEIGAWEGVTGLQADIRAYGRLLYDEAFQELRDLYPPSAVPGGGTSPTVAWVWARLVNCPNPACQVDVPLVKSWWLTKKKGREAHVVPSLIADLGHPSGRRLSFSVSDDPRIGPLADDDGTVDRTGATCLACSTRVGLDYVRAEGSAGRLRFQLMATVAEGNRRRVYCSPTPEQEKIANVDRPVSAPDAPLPKQAPSFRVQAYGMRNWSDLFTNRQLLSLTTFTSLVDKIRAKVLADSGSLEYADAIATYLALAISRYADMSNALCSWNKTNQNVHHLFSRHAIPMVWDFVEANCFGQIGLLGPIESVANSIFVAPHYVPGRAKQADASLLDLSKSVLATDPPYYDNVGYSDLSDFFYVWLRQSLREIHPDLFGTMLVPKAEELVANSFRHGGKRKAHEFFEDGFRHVFKRASLSSQTSAPITVWYAFKQSEQSANGLTSSGWETLLEGMVAGGWEITSTWPVRSERANRSIGIGTNALASSIVLSLRPRAHGASTTDRRGFIADLESELPNALRRLQQGQVAPVDLPQAAIGPGMAVFSRYSAVLEPDGSRMTVRAALSRINEALDHVLNEQEGDFDPTSRFAIAWYRQHGYGVGKFGDADNLARARNTSVDAMDRDEILTSRAGDVQLTKPADLPWDYDILQDGHTSNWEALHHLIKVLERDGIAPAGDFLQVALSRSDGAVDGDLVKELAHLLFRIAEGNGWTKDALSFNSLVTSWPEVLEVARSAKKPSPSQGAFDFDEDE